MEKEQIEKQMAWAHWEKTAALPFFEKGLNPYAYEVGFIDCLNSPEAKTYHELQANEAIKELVASLDDIIKQHVAANFYGKDAQSDYNASLRRANELITKYKSQP